MDMKLKLNTPLLIFFAGLTAGILVLGIFAFNARNEKPAVAAMPYKWQSPTLPEKMDFAGEPVPLDRWEIREDLDRQLLYNYYYQNNILFIMKLSNRYFPIIEERLRANGVPDDFKYLCVAESNLQNAISRVGAVGFWQFMSYTAPGYNLELTDQVDHRYDVIRSTDAACKYLKLAYQKFGSWTAAAASYNCGQGGYASHSAYQKTKNYYDLLLPDETNKYIFRILTFKYILSNAKELGFLLEENQLYRQPPVRTVTVTASIPNLADFAIQHGTTYKMLKLLNPWLRAKALTVKSGKSYVIRLPA
jgi:membrane-bound lytic murein transglycosylase D